jgi:hypothetical protein
LRERVFWRKFQDVGNRPAPLDHFLTSAPDRADNVPGVGSWALSQGVPVCEHLKSFLFPLINIRPNLNILNNWSCISRLHTLLLDFPESSPLSHNRTSDCDSSRPPLRHPVRTSGLHPQFVSLSCFLSILENLAIVPG